MKRLMAVAFVAALAILFSGQAMAPSFGGGDLSGNLGIPQGNSLWVNAPTDTVGLSWNGANLIFTGGGFSTASGNISAGSGNYVSANLVQAASNQTQTLQGQKPDGASAVGVIINNTATLSTVGSKIASFQNNSSEKAFLDKDGNARLNHLSCAMSAATTCTVTVPTGSVCQCQAQAGTATAQSCAVVTTTATCTASASNSNTWNVLVW